MYLYSYMCILFNIILATCLMAGLNGFVENIANNRTMFKEYLEQDDTFHVPGDKWTTEAIQDIAYFLRNHKFNSKDNRLLQEKPKEVVQGFFGAFRIPPLQPLHWKVKENCHNDFYKCITYLYGVTNTAPVLRTERLLINDSSICNDTVNNRLYYDCKERYVYADKIGLPFDDPEEKFQWSVTASYYMCWYTMLGIPALTMIGDSCDNFANCWDTYFGKHNLDPRADDTLSFKCAMYSFCPDPCCPIKHIESFEVCYSNKRNPCFLENSEGNLSQKICQLDREQNQNFNNIIHNKWNITCNCTKGFQWISKFGMCVDVNECLLETHDCDVIAQDCLNVPGTFLCICKWGFELNVDGTSCLIRNFTL